MPVDESPAFVGANRHAGITAGRWG